MNDVTHSRGILHKEGAKQSRWAMTFDDPKVLTQINAVFVTAESYKNTGNLLRRRTVVKCSEFVAPHCFL